MDHQKDATYNGVNLLNGNGNFRIQFSEDNSSDFNIQKVSAGATGLGISLAAVSANWSGTGFATAISGDLGRVEAALTNVRRFQTAFATATGLLSTRASFTEGMMQTLRAGADQLTVADMDEEGARLASLNVRGQLAQTTLGLAIQREQSILRLLG